MELSDKGSFSASCSKWFLAIVIGFLLIVEEPAAIRIQVFRYEQVR